MIKPKLEILLNGIWTELSYSGDNITIVRKRDDVYKMVIRTSADGDFEFITCETWNILLPYFNTYNQLEGRLTVYSCNGNTIYNGFLTLKNNANYALNICKGSFFIKDKYYSILDNKDFDKKILMQGGIGSILPTPTYQYIYSRVGTAPNEIIRCAHNYTFNLGLVIDFLVNQLDTTIVSNIRNYVILGSFYLVNAKSWKQNNDKSFDQDVYELPLYSLSEILETLQNQFFYTWHISNNQIVIEYLKNIVFSNGTLDVSNNETIDSQNLEFDNSKYSSIQLVSTNIKQSAAAFEKYFNTMQIDFANIKKNIASQNNNFETNVNIFDNSKPYLLQLNKPTGDVNFEVINNNFINYTGGITYLLGDWTYLNFNGLTIGDQIRTNVIDVQTFKKIEFTFNTNFVGYQNGDLKIRLLRFTDNFGNQNFDYYNVSVGYNSFVNINNSNDQIITIIAYKAFAETCTIANFKVWCSRDDFFRVANFNSLGLTIPNFNLSNYSVLNDFAGDFPDSNGTLKLQNNETFNLTNLHTKPDCFKNIQTDFSELIDSYDFGKLVNTKQGWFQIDTIKKSTYNTDFELSKKY